MKQIISRMRESLLRTGTDINYDTVVALSLMLVLHRILSAFKDEAEFIRAPHRLTAHCSGIDGAALRGSPYGGTLAAQLDVPELAGLTEELGDRFFSAHIAEAIDISMSLDFTKDVIRGDYLQIRDDFFTAQRILFLGLLKDGNLTTPVEVAHIFQRILQVRADETVLDPFMGSGELLLRTASGAQHLSGQDRNSLMVTLASVNALVSNERIEVREADSLIEPLPGKADVVLSHIPFTPRFSVSGDTSAYMKFGEPGNNGGGYYYMSLMIHLMNHRGAALVTEGDLIRSGREADIRRRLIEEGLIDAVIALPPGIYDGSAIGSSILMFSKERTSDRIQFIDARELFQKVRGGVRLSEEGLNTIDRLYAGQTDEPGFSRCEPMNKVLDEDAVLTVQRYTAVQEERKSSDIAQLAARMKQLEGQMDSQRAEVNRLIKKLF